MGAGMAANLLKAGHDVTVYNRTRTKVEALVAQGAKAAASVSDACHGDAVMTMLANDDAVESVVFGDGGIIDSLAAARSIFHRAPSALPYRRGLRRPTRKRDSVSSRRRCSAVLMSRPRVNSSSLPPVRLMR